MTIRTKPVTRLTTEELDACARLTIPNGQGAMQGELFRAVRRREASTRAVMLRDAGEIIAWALLFGSAPTAYFYVKPSRRREGHGRRLYKHIEARIVPEFDVDPHARRSAAFFRACAS